MFWNMNMQKMGQFLYLFIASFICRLSTIQNSSTRISIDALNM